MDQFRQILSSYKTTVVLLVLFAVGLGAATFIEKYHGTQAAKAMIYYSPFFFLVQFLLVVNFILVLMKYRHVYRRRWGMFVIHFAFIVILLGALVTHLFGKEGQIHIREGESSDRMIIHTSEGVTVHPLPFRLELIDFRLNRYPGSASPSSYESDLLVHVNGEIREARVYMNNVLDVKGYRFFQASYDEDEKGTILSVNQDVVGRIITYTGYFLLLIGFILLFVSRKSRFRQLNRQLKEVRSSSGKRTVLFLFFISSLTVFGQHMQSMSGESMMEAIQENAIDPHHAARFGALPVQSRGRVMPVNTFSSEILRKVHKEKTLGKLNSDQFLLSLLSMPQMWMRVPFIAVSNKEIARFYRLPEEYCAYYQAFDEDGTYRLMPQLHDAYNKPFVERTNFDKDLIKFDERINIVFQLLNHGLLTMFPNPDDPSHSWYAPGDDLSVFPEEDSLFITRSFGLYLNEVNNSLRGGNWNAPDQLLDMIGEYQRKRDMASLIHPKKLQAEMKYNRSAIFDRCKLAYFILGGLLLISAFIQLLKPRKWGSMAAGVLTGTIIVAFICHMYGMGMRWYISGYAPWSNSYETMVYVAWVTVLAGLVFGRKSAITLSLATLFGGIILFVSSLNWMDPQINPLVPVLKSPWLMFHVAVIVAAYGFFGISFLLGIVNLSIMTFRKNDPHLLCRMKELSIINNLSLLVGLVLMTTGTFIGAVWANESWGRYWGWDPKETWALITVVVYTVVTHLHLVKKWDNLWLFNLLSVLAFSSVLMTYFGVNYFLSGMHSYGQTEGISSVFLYIAVAFAALGILGIVSRIKSKESGTRTFLE